MKAGNDYESTINNKNNFVIKNTETDTSINMLDNSSQTQKTEQKISKQHITNNKQAWKKQANKQTDNK